MNKQKTLVRFSFALSYFLLIANFGFIYGQDSPNDSDKLVFEVTRIGKGNIFPLKNQLYFRLYNNGRIEYQIPPRFDPNTEKPTWDFITKSIQLKEVERNRLLNQVGSIDFREVRFFYPALEKEIDALMITKISINSKKGLKDITFHNIRLDHKNAPKLYPDSLVKLLKIVVELRPKTKEEIIYNWDRLY